MNALQSLVLEAKSLVGDLRRLVADLQVQKEGYLGWSAAAKYTGLSISTLRRITPPELRYRISDRKVLLRKSELDEFLAGFRELPERDLRSVANEACEAIFER